MADLKPYRVKGYVRVSLPFDLELNAYSHVDAAGYARVILARHRLPLPEGGGRTLCVTGEMVNVTETTLDEG